MDREDRFDVVLLGFREGLADPPAVGLERVFGIDGRTAMQLLSRLPRTVQKNVPRVRAEYFRRALVLIGANVEVRTRRGQVVIADPDAELASARGDGASSARPVEPLAPTQPAFAPRHMARAPAAAPPSLAAPASSTLTWGRAAVPSTPPSGGAAATKDDRPARFDSPTDGTTNRGEPPPEYALPAATLLAPVPPSTERARVDPDPARIDVAPPRPSPLFLHASEPTRIPAEAPEFEPPPPLFGPSSKTVVDTSASAMAPAPRPAPAPVQGARANTFLGVSRPPPSGSLPPAIERPKVAAGAAPINPPAGLDWRKLSQDFAPKVEASRSGATSVPMPPPASDAEAAFDRFLPANPDAFTTSKDAEPEGAVGAGPTSTASQPRNKRLAGRRSTPIDGSADATDDAESTDPHSAPTARNAPRSRAPRTQGALEPPAAHVDTRSFWDTVGEAIALPFQGHGLYWMFGITVWSLAAGIFGMVAGFFPMPLVSIAVIVIAQSSVLAFACDFSRVCVWVPTTGERNVDRGPQLDPERILSTYILSGLHLMAFLIASMIPAGAWLYLQLQGTEFTDPRQVLDAAFDPILWALLTLPLAYWPIGVGLTALANNFAAIWNLPQGLKAFRRAPLACFAIVAIGWLAFGAITVLLALFGSSMGLSGALLQAGGGFPLAASHGIMGSLFGHLIRARPDLLD